MIRSLAKIVAIAVSLVVIPATAHAELLVHYTFDNISNTVVVDFAGSNQSAQIVNEAGGLGVETGVPGVFGDAIRLPNDDGLSYVRLLPTLNPTPNGADERTIAFWFNQELAGVENKMFGYGTSASGQSFDVSLEGGGIRLRYSGGNVTWGSGFDFDGSDAGFHHVAIRVPENASDYLDIEVLLNGNVLPGVATGGSPGSTAINTGGGSPTELNIGRSPAFSPAGDFIGLIDDFRIYDHALTDNEVRELLGIMTRLTLEVDPVTGQGVIRNLTDNPVDMTYYELASQQAALDPASWNRLEQQNRLNFPAGSGVGDGWETLSATNDELLAEGRLLGTSSLEPGAWIDLGTVYDPGQPQDLSFTYHDGQSFVSGGVEYVAVGSTADFDRDGAVDDEDLSRWSSTFAVDGAADANADGDSDGADFLAWQRQLNTTPTLGGSQAVPEPATLAMISIGLLAASCKHRRVAPAVRRSQL